MEHTVSLLWLLFQALKPYPIVLEVKLSKGLLQKKNYLNLFSRGLEIRVFKINDTIVMALNLKRKLSQNRRNWRQYSADYQMGTKLQSAC